MQQYEVPVERLRWQCNPQQFRFDCTEDLTPLEEFIGQDRAIKSIQFGLAMEHTGYNIFVTGLTGTGKTSVIKSYLEKVVAEKGIDDSLHQPQDWCYVHNFTDPDRAEVIGLPKGQGKVLRTQLQDLLRTLRSEINKVFTSEDYDAERKRATEEGQQAQQQAFRDLEKEAQAEGFAMQLSQMGVVLIPLLEGRPLDQSEYMALPEEQKSEIENRRNRFMERVNETFQRSHILERDTLQRIREMDRRYAEFAISNPIRVLQAEYSQFSQISTHLEEIRTYTLNNLDHFRETDGQQAQQAQQPDPAAAMREREAQLAFQVNVFVDNSATVGPPIVIENNPTFSNLFGKIERRAFMGTYFTDHTMLKPGSVSQANGGYLVLNARNVVGNPGVWEGLKRVIRNQELPLEDPFEQFAYVVPHGLRPQPIPLRLKVIMIGDSNFYHLLSMYDEDFWEIFKVKADFDYQIDRNPQNIEAYASFICGVCQREKLRHFGRTGVAKVLEHGARMVADQTKLSTRFGQIQDLLIEAEYWARQNSASLVEAEHVRKAVEQKVYRSNLIQERIRDLISQGTILVDVTGSVVGQVNGLAVYDLGDISFGRPSRITAKTFIGRGGIINIEREAQLSGKTHDKGVLILSGYLGWKYAQDKPLSLAASLCFEQSYEGVDGDSASSTELYAILSSLSGLPLKQSIAVTGSVNQKGEVQPIGGVNQKVEGFFDICKAKGFTGDQGVMVPHQNVQNLMLREDVVEAVAQGQFRLYAIKTIDEGIEILTGVKAGERGDGGAYPEDTINGLVDKRLKELAKGFRDFAEEEHKEDRKQD